MVVLALVGSFYPFRLDAPRRLPNRVVREGGGLVFFDGVAPVPTITGRTIADALAGGTVQLDLEVVDSGPQTGPARILTLSEDVWRTDLMVGQRDRDLVVRVRRPGSDPDGEPALVVPEVLDGRRHHVRLRLTNGSVDVAVDGGPRLTRDWSVGRDGWSDDHRLLLGNEFGGSRPWHGLLLEATLTTRGGAIDLVAEAVLPQRYVAVPDRWVSRARWYQLVHPTASQVLQALVFAAIAVMAAAAFPSHTHGRVLVGCAGLAGVLLLGKFAVAGRHPSLADSIVQIAGASIGLGVLSAWWWWRGRS